MRARLLAERDFSMQGVGPPPAMDGDEHVAVPRRRRELVDTAVRAVTPDEEHYEDVAAEIGHLVDALAAATRVRDPDLLTDFARWQREVMTARNLPVAELDKVLETCATRLADHPRARSYLDRARVGLTG